MADFLTQVTATSGNLAMTSPVVVADGSMFYGQRLPNTSSTTYYIYKSTDKGATWNLYYTLTSTTNQLTYAMAASRGSKLVFALGMNANLYYMGIDTAVLPSGSYVWQSGQYTGTAGLWFSNAIDSSTSDFQPLALYIDATEWIYIGLQYYDGSSYIYKVYRIQYGLSTGKQGSSATTGQVNSVVEYGNYVTFATFLNYVYRIDKSTGTVTGDSLTGTTNYAHLLAHPSNGYLYKVYLGTANPPDLYLLRTTDQLAKTGWEYFNGSTNLWQSSPQASAVILNSSSEYIITAQMDQSGSIYVIINAVGSVAQIKFTNVGTTTTNQGRSTLFTKYLSETNGLFNWSNNSIYPPKNKDFLVMKYIPGNASDRAFTFVRSYNQAPNAPTITSPGGGQKINTRTPTITWTFSDPDAGNTQSAFDVQIVNSAYSAVLWDSGWISSSATSYAIPSGAITADGTYYVRMQVKDNSGVVNTANGAGPDPNYYSIQFVVDTVPPTGSAVTANPIYVNNATKGAVAMTVNASDAVSLSIVRFAVWGDVSGQNDLVWYDGTNNGNGTWSKTVNMASHDSGVDQHYNCDVYAYDTAGNNAMVAHFDIYVDNVAPTIGSIDALVYSGVNSGTQRVTVQNVADAVSLQRTDFWYRKSTDGGSTWGSWTGPVTGTQSGANWYYDIPKSGDGKYQVDARAYDKAGNVSNSNNPITTYFVVDSVKSADPSPSIAYGKTTATVSWSAFSDSAPSSGYKETRIYMDKWSGSAWVAEPNNGTVVTTNVATLSTSLTGLVQGALYRVAIAHFDNSGNQSLFTYVQFTTKKQIGTAKIQTGAGAVVVPVYDPASGVIGSKGARMACNSGVIGCLELVATNDPNATHIHINTPTGIKSISK